MKNIILFGVKHCGKTTVGQLLATKLNLPFVDTDDLVVEIAEKKQGKKLSVREIVKLYGQSEFESLEKQAVRTLQNTENFIISVGGSTLLDPTNTEQLQSNSVLFYLSIQPNIALDRIKKTGIPTFLDPENLEQSFAEYFQLRHQLYQHLASHIIEVDQRSIEEVVNDLQQNYLW